MTIKLIYIIVFAVTDLVIWLILNRPGTLSQKLQYLFAVIFALFIILHMGIIKSELLLPWRGFFNLTIVTCAPVLLWAWYTGLMARRKNKNKTETQFDNVAFRVTNLVFLYLINIAALVVQVLMIFGFYPGKL